MAKVRHCVWVSPSSILTIAHNLFRQFLNVTFNENFCKLALFLFYGTPAEYIASGNSWWLLWPKCWLETEFDFRFRLRFSQFNQVNQTNWELCTKLKNSHIVIETTLADTRHLFEIYIHSWFWFSHSADWISAWICSQIQFLAKA